MRLSTLDHRRPDENAAAWDRLVAAGCRHARVASDDDLRRPLAALDPSGWLGGDVRGRRVLCLAAGGGYQSILYAAAGAEVTVFDLSPAMLELDRRESQRRKLRVRIVQGSMEDLSALARDTFDVVHQPVSTCYVPDVRPVFREVARVLRPGGVYISQHKQPVSLQAAAYPELDGRYRIERPYRRDLLPEVAGTLHREPGTREYLHTLSDLLGGICAAGLVIEALSEPRFDDPRADAGRYGHRCCFVPPYLRVEARKPAAGRAPLA